MIVVLHNEACGNIANCIQTDLLETFQDHISVALALDSIPYVWPSDVNWDDLLIVLYDEHPFPNEANTFIEEFLRSRPDTAMILPVAINKDFPVPPGAAKDYKALAFDGNSLGANGRLIHRAGAMLGLRLQGRNTKVFISYRAVDGKQIASQIYDYLYTLGYKPWLDEAKDLDGATQILPGNLVQKEIENALSEASLVLLVDTPESYKSKWIKEEINTADSMLIPVLPVVFRSQGDGKKGPRFRALLSLQRWIDMTFLDVPTQKNLSDAELEKITVEIETYLCDIFVRKCRVPFLVERSFKAAGYDWEALDRALLMFRSHQEFSPRLKRTIHSHCSIFDQIYDPARARFKSFLQTQPRANHSLFVYDGDLWPEDEFRDYLDDDMIVLHHQELSALLASHFTKLGGA
ncbi:toll/interleukin-1 receptor domain-containing protein [Achromobacter spanius]|uniref:toll/interleukin-1 receptor domain-containing protein n=1 Tax=Achromobacter spanius TaxID=217203 RepID=UPI000F8F9F84|nr:toll/interleukin-1 receptor domain-containing protein [Achromobacter spanius]AZS80097.1 toll/interleukin-1 receptor domain-containing protein [Achromobacter spanius]